MHAPLRALLCALPLLAYAASSTTPAFAYDDAGYLAYADRMQMRLDPLWSEYRGQYSPGPGGVDTLVNAMCLLTHSVAAQAGHSGPSRNDHRARLVAKALVSAPVFIEHAALRPKPGSQTHAPGWTSSMGDATAGQHLMYDAEIVDGLVHAWKARKALGLSDELAAEDRRPHPPRRALALLALADDPAQPDQLVRADVRRRRDRHRRPDPAAPRHARTDRALPSTGTAQLRPGPALPVPPAAPPWIRSNVDSAEYANIVLSFLRFYNQARPGGDGAAARARGAGSCVAGSGARWRATGRTAAT